MVLPKKIRYVYIIYVLELLIPLDWLSHVKLDNKVRKFD